MYVCMYVCVPVSGVHPHQFFSPTLLDPWRSVPLWVVHQRPPVPSRLHQPKLKQPWQFIALCQPPIHKRCLHKKREDGGWEVGIGGKWFGCWWRMYNGWIFNISLSVFLWCFSSQSEGRWVAENADERVRRFPVDIDSSLLQQWYQLVDNNLHLCVRGERTEVGCHGDDKGEGTKGLVQGTPTLFRILPPLVIHSWQGLQQRRASISTEILTRQMLLSAFALAGNKPGVRWVKALVHQTGFDFRLPPTCHFLLLLSYDDKISTSPHNSLHSPAFQLPMN